MNIVTVEENSNHKIVDSMVVLIALTTCLIINPYAHFYGRFWGEEGSYFFENIYRSSAFDSVFYIYKGTLQITSNLSLLLATRVSMEHAPLITTWVGTVFLCYFIYLFLQWARIHSVNIGIIILSIILLLVSGQTYEVLSNSTNLQWICSLCVMVAIFLPDHVLQRRFYINSVLILLAGLSGVPSSMLAPSMMLRGLVVKSWTQITFAIILGCTALIQIFIILSSQLEERDTDRYSIFELFYVSVIRPPLGLLLTQKGSQTLMSAAYARLDVLILFGFAVIVLAGTLYLIWRWSGLKTVRHDATIIVLTGCLISAVNIFGSLSTEIDAMLGIGGGRYYLVGFVAVLMILCLASRSLQWRHFNLVGLVLVVAVAINLAYAIAAGTTTRHTYNRSWQGQLRQCAQAQVATCNVVIWPANMGPRWTTEVDMSAVSVGR